MRTVLAATLLAGVCLAKPPLVPDYARMEELGRKLRDVYAEVKEKEEFASKPFQERLVIKFAQGATSYERISKLTGREVIEQVFEEWEAVEKEPPGEEVKRVLALLPDALKKTYNIVPIPKKERFRASEPLVDALTHEAFHVREAAIECLRAIYGSTRLYQPDLPPQLRRKRKAEWKQWIRKMSR